MKKNILITGASGFIGSHLTKNLEKSFDLFLVGNPKENKIGYLIHNKYQEIDFKALPKIDFLLHHAAITDTTIADENLMLKENFLDARKFFDKALNHGCKFIVSASSCSIYGNGPVPFREDQEPKPLNIYAKSKLLLEESCKDLPVCFLRYSNVYGDNETYKKKSASLISQILSHAKKDELITLFRWGEQSRDFVHVTDVVNANELAIQKQTSGVFNIGCGVSKSFNQIITLISRKLKKHLRVEYVDNPFEETYQSNTLCDLKKTKGILGFAPKISLEEGVANL